MCKVMQRYEDIAREEGREEGRREGRERGKIEGMQQNMISLVKKGLLSAFDAARESGLTEEEFSKLLNKA